jgi:hypothetical protein
MPGNCSSKAIYTASLQARQQLLNPFVSSIPYSIPVSAAVYGFVQPEGNPADRLEFLPAAELLASEGVTGTSDLTQPPGLSLARMQSALGYALFSDAVTAKQVGSGRVLRLQSGMTGCCPWHVQEALA